MPRSPAQNELLREASTQRVLEHALRLFAEHGYDATTMKMIAASASISPGLIYNYFASKEDLLRAIFVRSMDDVRASFAEAEAAAPGERLERLIRASFEILRRNRDFWRLSYGARMQQSVLAVLGDALPQWLAEIGVTLQRYLAEAGAPDPEIEARLLFALIDGVSQHYVLDPDRYPLDAVADALIARHLRTRVP
jgi:AcrR family transcriptional regulator